MSLLRKNTIDNIRWKDVCGKDNCLLLVICLACYLGLQVFRKYGGKGDGCTIAGAHVIDMFSIDRLVVHWISLFTFIYSYKEAFLWELFRYLCLFSLVKSIDRVSFVTEALRLGEEKAVALAAGKSPSTLSWNELSGEGGCRRTKPLSYTAGSVQRASFVDSKISHFRTSAFVFGC
ncbi:hypothetical protein C5167_036325 [Papaver somniferum]|uniref:Uncharacterized protein n=1 Tax=Papaver somniferum TaxID=3469 RepID=A0A4Y7I3B2_PAPSO|nr:hypothetical protein C5167_036325 [Papaver somniferum]